ncbi:MAG: glycosyltransferase [Ignavibacteriales bacterium]|nr:glycosyltransferase [Ignavibacteriales bacterium]
MSPLRLKVLFLASWYPNRVAKVLGIFVRRKAEAMTGLCDVAVLHVAEDGQMFQPSEFECSDVNGVLTTIVYFRPGGPGIWGGVLYNIRYFRSYYLGWKLIKQRWGRPNVVHVNVVDRAGYFALFLKKIAGLPYVITEHSTPDIDFVKGLKRTTHVPLRPLKKLVIKNSGKMNVDSQASLRYLEMCGFNGEFCVIPNVVEIIDRFAAAPKEKLRPGKIIGAHISILIGRKNIADIVRAVASIYYTHGRKEIEFHIIGEGGLLEELRALAADLKVLDTAVFFRGFLSEEEKGRLLAASDFHVLNSESEGFSVVTAEAISYGVPVIATACGGPEDFVTERTGLLIGRNDLPGLERAMLFMMDHASEYDRRELQEFGRARFSSKAVAAQTYAMYRSALTSWPCGNTATPVTILPEWQVLDIGSGHQPHPRANVLLDKYTGETEHRTSPIVLHFADKSFVTGDALEMPFLDKSFDFAIASHIAEHVDDPAVLCSEMSCVFHFAEKKYTPPPSQLFFRFFYLNRDGYADHPMKSQNPLLLLLNWALVTCWKYIPGAYSKIEWAGEIRCIVRRLPGGTEEHAI